MGTPRSIRTKSHPLLGGPAVGKGCLDVEQNDLFLGGGMLSETRSRTNLRLLLRSSHGSWKPTDTG